MYKSHSTHFFFSSNIQQYRIPNTAPKCCRPNKQIKILINKKSFFRLISNVHFGLSFRMLCVKEAEMRQASNFRSHKSETKSNESETK